MLIVGFEGFSVKYYCHVNCLLAQNNVLAYACITILQAGVFMAEIEGKDPKKVAAAMARKKSLSPEERSAIARMAALARHDKGLPKAQSSSAICGLRVPCL